MEVYKICKNTWKGYLKNHKVKDKYTKDFSLNEKYLNILI
ncbi:hypothetical protein CLCAR_1452 [Clostridium carboxidivorans P7]|nr:hypothetical protein CLCAR_1452 [Clostridium carboxidivorans P7]